MSVFYFSSWNNLECLVMQRLLSKSYRLRHALLCNNYYQNPTWSDAVCKRRNDSSGLTNRNKKDWANRSVYKSGQKLSEYIFFYKLVWLLSRRCYSLIMRVYLLFCSFSYPVCLTYFLIMYWESLLVLLSLRNGLWFTIFVFLS